VLGERQIRMARRILDRPAPTRSCALTSRPGSADLPGRQAGPLLRSAYINPIQLPGTTKSTSPRHPGKGSDVIHYNISYLYIRGSRPMSPTSSSGPALGRWTDCADVATRAWSAPARFAAADGRVQLRPVARGRRYGQVDNHGTAEQLRVHRWARVVLKDNIHDTFFRSPTSARRPNPQNVNLIDLSATPPASDH